MDNIVFNVNGSSKGQLLATIKLALMSQYHDDKEQTVAAWKIDPKKGFILYWSDSSGANKFPVPLSSDEITDIVWKWLKSEEGEKFPTLGKWDINMSHDGHNKRGFRVYTEDWGQVDGDSYSIVAIRPVYCWYGK
jgi:hypothetical protein